MCDWSMLTTLQLAKHSNDAITCVHLHVYSIHFGSDFKRKDLFNFLKEFILYINSKNDRVCTEGQQNIDETKMLCTLRKPGHFLEVLICSKKKTGIAVLESFYK